MKRQKGNMRSCLTGVTAQHNVRSPRRCTLPEPIQFQQEQPDQYGSLSDPGHLFPQSVVPEELRGVVFNMRTCEFEALFNVEIYRMPKRTGCGGFVRFTGDEIRILDIDPENRLRIGWDWSEREGGGSSVYCATALAMLDGYRLERIVKRWRALKDNGDHIERCGSVLEHEGLSYKRVRTRIEALLKEHELDQASVEKQRRAALFDAGLCDGSDESLARHKDLVTTYPTHL